MNRFFSNGSQTSGLAHSSPIAIPFKLDLKGASSDADGSSLMLQMRVFNDPSLDPKQCCNALALLFCFLFGNSESRLLSQEEATAIFFSITKAFQCKDVGLCLFLSISLDISSQIGVFGNQMSFCNCQRYFDGYQLFDPGHKLQSRYDVQSQCCENTV